MGMRGNLVHETGRPRGGGLEPPARENRDARAVSKRPTRQHCWRGWPRLFADAMAAMGGDGRRNLRTVKCCRVLALSMTFLVAIAGGVFAQRTFTWAAGPAGGGWYAISTGMAHILRDKVDLSVKVVPGGGAQNPVLVDRGEAEIGMSVRPLLEAATRGETPYRGTKLENVRALAGNMSPTVVHFYVGAD